MIIIQNVLDRTALDEVRSSLAEVTFVDGKATAGRSAKLVKDNEQAEDGPVLQKLRQKVSQAIIKNALFSAAVRPKAITPLIFSRYGPGQQYGSHVDNALMRGLRTDVSFTLFLADPAAYDGGELVIEAMPNQRAIKLPAGHMVAYSSSALHRVNPVTRGERTAAVGWAQSFIREQEKRELLLDLERVRQSMFEQNGKTAELDLLSKTSANLLRMWANN